MTCYVVVCPKRPRICDDRMRAKARGDPVDEPLRKTGLKGQAPGTELKQRGRGGEGEGERERGVVSSQKKARNGFIGGARAAAAAAARRHFRTGDQD